MTPRLRRLTPTQVRMLEAILAHARETGRMPSYRELGRRIGHRSTRATYDVLYAMHRRGAVRIARCATARALVLVPWHPDVAARLSCAP